MTSGIQRRGVTVLLGACAIGTSLSAQAATVVPERNVDSSGVALHGFDPVGYFTDGKPVEGDPQHSTTYQGATYWFARDDHRNSFLADPERYLPRYGGFCAYAAANGYKADIDPEAWKIVDGRLYLNYNPQIGERWQSNQAAFIAQADQNWPRIGPIPADELD